MHTKQPVYLNTASFGLIDPEVKASADALYQDLAQHGSTVAEAWRMDSEPRIRETIAAFLGAASSQVAMVPNYSWAMNALVQSLTGKERVLLYRGDFPSVLEPFQLNGFEIRWIDTPDGFELPLDEIAHCIKNIEVDLVALSHVQYNSGYRLPLQQVADWCREQAIPFIVDATQSLGAMPIDVRTIGMDVLIASNYKWMNAGFGTGIAYFSDEFLKKYPPVVGGFHSMVVEDGDFIHELGAKSYEPGHPNVYGQTLLKAAIVQIQKRGLEETEQHNLALAQQLLEGIKDLSLALIGPTNMQHRCSIILLRDESGLSDWIKDGGFIVTIRGGHIRISMHHYNTAEEVAALVERLRSWSRKIQ